MEMKPEGNCNTDNLDKWIGLIILHEDNAHSELMDYGVHFELEDGTIMSHANTEDWKNATRVQRLIGFFWKGYKNQFIKPETFKAKTK